MATISHVIRWADNTKELQTHLKEGLNQIEAVRSSAEKMAKSLGGDNLLRAAHNMTAAVTELGGAARLTAQEKERVNALVQKAIDKYAALGKTAPRAMLDLAEATRSAEAPTTALTGKMVALGSAIGTFLGNAIYDLARRGLSALFDGFKSAIDISNQFQASFIGLSALAGVFGVSAGKAKDAAASLANDGLMTVAEAASGLKNLLASGFGLPEAVKLMQGFKDSAAFNRQAALGFGQAVVSATEGIKNQNSTLIDNAGITKNYSVIAKEAGLKTEDLAKISTDAGVRQKVYAGLLKETGIFAGNAALATQTYSGAVSKLSTAWDSAKAQIGDAITQNKTLITAVNLVADALYGLKGGTQETSEAVATLVSRAVILFIDLAKAAVDSAQGIYQAYHVVIGMLDFEWKNWARGILEVFKTQIQAITAVLLVWRKFDVTGEADKNLKMIVAMQAVILHTTKTQDVFSGSLDNTSKSLARIRGELEKTIGQMSALNTATAGGSRPPPASTIDTTGTDFIESATKSVKKLAVELQLAKTTLSDADFMKQFASRLDDVRVTLDQLGMTGARVPSEIAAGFERLGKIRIAEMIAGNAQDMRDQMGKIVSAVQKAADDGAKTVMGRMQTNLKGWESALDASEKLTAQHTKSSFDYQLFILEEEGRKKKEALDKYGAFYTEALAAIDQETAAAMLIVREEHNREVFKMQQSVNSWGNTWRDVALGVPGLLKAAFTGGGGLKGALDAIGATAGEGIFKNLFFGGEKAGPLTGLLTKATNGISGLLGKGVGDAFAMAIPGIGAAIGPLIMKGLGAIGGAIKNLFGGPSQKELEGRAAAKSFTDSITSALTATQKLEVQMAVAEGHSRKWAETVISIRDAYLATGRTAEQAARDQQRLFEAEKRGAEAVKKVMADINQAFIEQHADAERLEAAIKKYGFAVEELGPKLRAQKLNEQALELIEDWRVLVGAGIDVALVNDKMAESINGYLQAAMKTGAEVPFAFRPILQSLIDQGKLMDANGNLITDLGSAGVTFAETLTQGFDRVVIKLQQLIDTLNGAGQAIENLPAISIPTETGSSDAGLSLWDRITQHANPMADGGFGRVTGPTLFLAGEGGPEDYAFSGGGKRFGGSGGDAMQSAILAELSALRRELAPKVGRAITDALTQAPRLRTAS